MKAANHSQFFKLTLDFKAVSAPNNPQETWLINRGSSLEAEQLQEWQIPARDAAYNALMEKLAANEVPVFTKEELDPKNAYLAHVVGYTQNLLNELSLNYLAQAIIDDEREIVKAMLDKKPELLLNRNFVIATSEHTGQRFSSDNILGLACRRKQIEMVKIILPYFDKLLADLDAEGDKEEIAGIEGIKNVGLAQWLQYRVNAEGEIEIPADYQAIIDGLIAVFKSENIANGTTDYRTLNANIETAMETLYNRLVPGYKEADISERRVFTKQNHLDVELLLYAAYNAYDTHFNSFQSWEQRNAYCIRVIGILQNFLSPETAKIFCEGLYYVVEENRAISGRAAELKLKDGASFYSGSDFALRSGLGFEFLARARSADMGGGGVGSGGGGGWVHGKLMSNKNNNFQGIIQRHEQRQTHQRDREHNQRRCVIC